MLGSGRRAAVAVVLMAGLLASSPAAIAGETRPSAARPRGRVSVVYPATPAGEALHGGTSLNERGQFLAKLPDGRAVVWDRGTVTGIGPAGTEVGGLSERGQVAGYQRNARGYVDPFTWTRRGGWTRLATGALDADWSVAAWDLNDRGQISGAAMHMVPGLPGELPRFQGVAWDRGQLVEPPRALSPCLTNPAESCMNDRGQVIGTVDVGGAPHAAVWQIGGDVVDLGTLGGASSSATAINDAGDVVGSSELAGGDVHAFLWRDGEMIDLGTLGGAHSAARDVNERGEVIGTSYRPGEVHQSAFVWREGEMTQLGSLTGTGDTWPADISDRGQVVGRSTTPEGRVRAVLWDGGAVVDLGALLDAEESEALEVNDRGQILGRAGIRPDDPVVLWTAPASRP